MQIISVCELHKHTRLKTISIWTCPGPNSCLISYKSFTKKVDIFLHFIHNLKLSFTLKELICVFMFSFYVKNFETIAFPWSTMVKQ